MGFFSLTVKCSICGENVGFNRFKLYREEWICPNCLRKCGGMLKFVEIQKLSIPEIQEIAGYKRKEKSTITMNPTKIIRNYLQIDEDNELIKVFEQVNKAILNEVIIPYSHILSYELLEDGHSVVKSGLASTIAGGLLLGNIGALIGSNIGKKSLNAVCEDLKLKITTKNLDMPVVNIVFVDKKISKDTEEYRIIAKDAQECASILHIIIEINNGTLATGNDDTSNIVKIRELASLRDEGIITEEEFLLKKSELLKEL